MKIRYAYPDFLKIFAIFVVTYSHCAQALQGSIWTNLLGGTELDLAFTMPLFMILSGWFLNFDKMRGQKAKDYISTKFKRLMVPALVWYVVFCVFTHSKPHSFAASLSYYWYLSALFACLCIIFFTCRLIKNNAVCAVVSIGLVLCCPYSDYSHINFMMPFLWAGYVSRKALHGKHATLLVIICCIAAIAVMPFWCKERTVYICPLNSAYITWQMAATYIYRFAIGYCISIPIIYLAMRFDKSRLVANLSKWGGYTLVVYTMSFVINGDIGKALHHLGFHVSQYGIIDLLAIVLALAIIFISIKFANICRKNKYSSLLFLGE